MLTVRVELGHVSVARLAESIALLSRKHKPRQRKIAENPHRRWLRSLTTHAKMLVVQVGHLVQWREAPEITNRQRTIYTL